VEYRLGSTDAGSFLMAVLVSAGMELRAVDPIRRESVKYMIKLTLDFRMYFGKT
jgi:hypothetical protein